MIQDTAMEFQTPWAYNGQLEERGDLGKIKRVCMGLEISGNGESSPIISAEKFGKEYPAPRVDKSAASIVHDDAAFPIAYDDLSLFEGFGEFTEETDKAPESRICFGMVSSRHLSCERRAEHKLD